MSDPARSFDPAPSPTDDRQTDRRGPRTGQFAGDRILIVGCGDVGRRVVARLGNRYRLVATTRTTDGAAALRAIGVAPIVADLDDPRSLGRLGHLASTVIHLAPPQPAGARDDRTRALIAAMRGVERLVYVSTSGVYGDCGGAWIDETRPVSPTTDRAGRRVDAERCLRAWALAQRVRLTILRVPGIYAADRLPIARLRAGTPVLRADDDVFTNHIHADDLARAIVAAMHRGTAQRIHHVVDDSALKMGDWFDLVADAFRLSRPTRMTRDTIGPHLSASLASFMQESRRLSNTRMHTELALRLRYPTVHEGLAGCTATR